MNPPYADNLIASSSSEYYCTMMSGTGIVYFSWDYRDVDGDYAKKFRFQVSTGANGTGTIVVDRTFPVSYPPGRNQQQSVFVKQYPLSDSIIFNAPYYWRVMVEDVTGLSSNWISYDPNNNGIPNSYTKTGHPAPAPAFEFSSNALFPYEVYFRDISYVCYNNDGPISCRDLTNGYTWNFGDNSAEDNTPGDVFHRYSSLGTYPASLRICDDIGCCTKDQDVPVRTQGGSGLPNWREISPF